MTMKKISACLLALLLSLSVATVAQAVEAGELSVPSAYVGEGTSSGTLYTFTSSPDADLADGFEAEATVTAQGDDQGRTIDGRTERVADSGASVFYYLLVDNSGSMKRHADWIEEFAGELVSEGGDDAVYSLGHFDSDFTSDVTSVSGQELLDSLGSIPYDGGETEPYTAIAKAIEAQKDLREEGLTPDCLMNVIIITDGQVATYSGDLSSQEAQASDAIAGSKDIVLHAVCVGSWDSGSDLYDVLSSGTGRCLPGQAGDGQTADATLAAGEICDFVGGLYRSEFGLGGDVQDGQSVQVRFASDEAGASYTTETVEDVPIVMNTADEEGASTDTDSADADSSSDEQQGEQVDEGQAAGPREGIPRGVLIAIVLVAAIAVIVILFAVLSRRGSGRKEARGGSRKVVRGPLAHVEVLRGRALRDLPDVPLVAGATFGSDPGCELPFDDASMAARHGRLYVSDGQAYVEPLQEDAPIYLNGMRIFAANPLRSGDVLEAGQTQVRITISDPDAQVAHVGRTVRR